MSLVKKSNILFMSVIISTSIVGMMFPYGFPLYSLLLLAFFVLLLFQGERFFFPKNLVVLYFLVFIYVFSALSTLTLYTNVVSDCVNILGFILLAIVSNSVIRTERDFDLMLKNVYIIVFYSSLVVSLVGLYKFQLLTKGIKIDRFAVGEEYPWGSSLVGDYNFFSLGLMFGILSGYVLFMRSKNIIFKVIVLSSMFLMSSCVFISGSRRGLVVFLLIILVFFS